MKEKKEILVLGIKSISIDEEDGGFWLAGLLAILIIVTSPIWIWFYLLYKLFWIIGRNTCKIRRVQKQ